jgi:hypothetical protein
LKYNPSMKLTSYPHLVKEWHPTKNGELTPDDFTHGSVKKVWWLCPKVEDHEWKATINNRSNGTGCPFCAGSGTSQPEIRILCELKYLFGSDEIAWRSRIDGVEIDIFISKYNIGIEYDGSHWHKGKLQTDEDKNKFFQIKDIQIIRVREHPLEVISINDIVVQQYSLTKDNLNALIMKIKAGLKQPVEINFDDYINNSTFLNEKEFNRFISFLPSPPPEYSFLNTNPEIVKQWHHEKNNPLKPENFTQYSGKKVWWKCSKGDDHEWKTTIAHRSGGRGCPFCSGKKTSKSNNLLARNPKVASEWHPTKNGNFRPENFTYGSDKKFWWKCPEGEDHEWETTIKHRSIGQDCPFCAGKKASKTNNLLVKNPKLASEWHPTKNKDLKPEELTPRSGKKVWWQCPKSEAHEWKGIIHDRSKRGKGGCPFCSGRKTLNYDLFK